ncbi:hypothetical protein PVAP13_8NG178301 [Panicum virgatum]|uniref:Uncharacterized protein n=1 Tax=Panicum virgatum TaxID=38727 RepID=A0A8T0P632_PANVG|nr:hypothetical protein PVAP13_8NG178301 [Panicum virgatum]
MLLCHLPRLAQLEITDCSDLTCGSTDLLQCISSLERLLVEEDCKNGTVALPERLGDLTSLTELSLLSCKGIKTLPESIQHLTCLRHLKINGCPELVALPERLGDLTSLVYLMLRDCDGIKSLPESIQQLTRLQLLEINGCPELVQWCILEENKMKLAHIKDIELDGIMATG